MKVYILYETVGADENGFEKDNVVGVYSNRKKAERAERYKEKQAEKQELDYTYCVIPEEVK